MPNYRYNTPDYMRRGQCPRPAAHTTAPCPPVSKTTCYDDRAEYDELSGMPIAMAYVPWQEWQCLFEAEKGFHLGTIFEELYKPFLGTGGCRK